MLVKTCVRHTDQKPIDFAENAVRRAKEGTSALLVQSGLPEKWWSDAMEFVYLLRKMQDRLADRKSPYEKRFGAPFDGPTKPVILTELPERRNCGVFPSRSISVTNKSNSLTHTVASSFVSTSPLAVITVVGTPRCPQGLQLRYWLRNLPQTLFPPALLLTQRGAPILPRASRM